MRGNDSTALAGAAADSRYVSETRLAIQQPTSRDNNNIATVVGNHSTASAGDGDNNRARVFGSRSSAAAFGGHRTVTSVGDDVHNPPAQQK